MSDYYSDIKFNDDNSITIMNHTITFDDIYERLYYNVNKAILDVNNMKLFNNLYYDKLNNTDKQKWDEISNGFLFNEKITKQHLIKPFYPNFNKTNNKNSDEIVMKFSDMIFKFKNINGEYLKSNQPHHHIGLGHKTLLFEEIKFRIKQERITSIIRKDLENKYNCINEKFDKQQDQITNIICKILDNTNNNIKRHENKYSILEQHTKINTENLENQLIIIDNMYSILENQIKNIKLQLKITENKCSILENQTKINTTKINAIYYIIVVQFIMILSLLSI